MPTAAKFIAAVVMAIFGYLTAKEVVLVLPEGQSVGWLFRVCLVVPAISGWRVIGRLIGKGYRLSINVGLYAVAVAVFFSALAFAIGEMIKRSIRLRYDGPMEAITNMFGILVEYLALLLNPGPALYIVVCALIVGPMAEYGHRKWG